jgi:hypothetical protein
MTTVEFNVPLISINVRFARAGEAFIVFDARHARMSRFSKPAPPARAKRLQWKPALNKNQYIETPSFSS